MLSTRRTPKTEKFLRSFLVVEERRVGTKIPSRVVQFTAVENRTVALVRLGRFALFFIDFCLPVLSMNSDIHFRWLV